MPARRAVPYSRPVARSDVGDRTGPPQGAPGDGVAPPQGQNTPTNVPPDDPTQTTARIPRLPSTDPSAAGPLAGDLLGGRYRLERLIRAADRDASGSDGGALWRGEDLVLSRPVAVRLLADAPPAQRRALLDAAGQAGRATDPLVAATYDAAEEQVDGRTVAYLVREWVEGRSLRDLLLDAPLAAERATFLLYRTATALAHLHAAGTVHGRVHPSNVLVRPDGQLRLTDPAVGAALAAPDGLAALAADEAGDVRDLGRTLYAALTGRWPGGPWRGLPAAPTGAGGALLPPRQVRAGLPRELDAVAGRIGDPARRSAHEAAPLTTAAAVAAALAPLPSRPTDAAEEPPRPARPVRAAAYRPWRRRGVLIALVAALAAGGWLFGLSVGRVPGQPTDVPAFTAQPSSSGAPPPPATSVVPIAAVTSFDPPPGEGGEHPDQVAFSHDGEQSTAWQTYTYTTANLGNLKPGTGLLVDLGSPQQIRQVDLTFLNPGTDVQLRAMGPDATAPGSALTDFAVVAQQSNAGRAVQFTTDTKARFWVIWLTRLPRVGSGYRGSVAEMAFRR